MRKRHDCIHQSCLKSVPTGSAPSQVSEVRQHWHRAVAQARLCPGSTEVDALRH